MYVCMYVCIYVRVCIVTSIGMYVGALQQDGGLLSNGYDVHWIPDSQFAGLEGRRHDDPRHDGAARKTYIHTFYMCYSFIIHHVYTLYTCPIQLYKHTYIHKCIHTK